MSGGGVELRRRWLLDHFTSHIRDENRIDIHSSIAWHTVLQIKLLLKSSHLKADLGSGHVAKDSIQGNIRFGCWYLFRKRSAQRCCFINSVVAYTAMESNLPACATWPLPLKRVHPLFDFNPLRCLAKLLIRKSNWQLTEPSSNHYCVIRCQWKI